MNISLLLDDPAILAVNKPAGLPTQAPAAIDSLERRVRAFLAERSTAQATPYLGIPHRLDRAVTGVILFALTPRAARKLSQQFERRTIQKRYWVLVQGIVEPSEGTWVDHLHKVPDEPRAEQATPDMPDAKEARLSYRTLGKTKFGSWLEIILETGRMHQIRLQASLRGHPVLGDALYGSKSLFGESRTDEREREIALHARSIEFEHPQTHSRVELTAPVSTAWHLLGSNFE